MSVDQINTILIGLVACFFGLLTVVLGWIGARVHTKLDNLYQILDEKLGAMGEQLGGIESELRNEISIIKTDLHEEFIVLDRRVTKIEVKQDR